MPCEVELVGRHAYIRFHGVVVGADLLEAGRILTQLERDAPAPFDRVADLSDVTQNTWVAEDLRELATSRGRQSPAPTYRLAIVAPGDTEFGYGRMFQMLREQGGVQINVFRARKAALDWLDTDGAS